jgi:cation transport ATPase
MGAGWLGRDEQGALLLLLFSLSHMLEERFTAKAQGSLHALFANLPDKVRLACPGLVSTSHALAGSRLFIAAGMKGMMCLNVLL